MRVRWRDPAQTDFLQIPDYISRHDPAAAARVGRRLPSIDALRAQPRLGRPGRISGTRELVVSSLPYIAIYRIFALAHASEVEALRIVNDARRWPDDSG